jgi:uncharacterized surface protein with fasciclin (FAS1) repeats
MRNVRTAAIFILLAGLAIAQDVPREASAIHTQDLLTTAQADRSLAMFVTAVQSSGMARMLREEGPLTVFALSNRAFANLPKEERETLLTDRAAMHLLLAHYIVRGSIAADDTASLQTARTLVGVKLHIDIRSEGSYVNGAKLNEADILCANGVIHVLDSFDPGLVHEAVAMAKSNRNQSKAPTPRAPPFAF